MQGPPDRPTLPPPGATPAAPGGDESGGGGGGGADHCAGLRGTVINWGFRNEPGVSLRLGDGSWEATQVTSDDGRYAFGALGRGMAFLAVDLSAAQAETLRPMADHLAISLRCDFDIVANLGLYSSSNRPDPPATLSMGVAPAAILPGGTTTFYLTLRNGMSNPISHVFATDYLPDGLTVAHVKTSRGRVEVLNRRMITVDVGDLPPGGEETVQIAVQADPGLAYGMRLQNTASLLYAESAADQAWASLVIGNAAGTAAATPTALLVMASAQSTPPPPAATATAPAEETPTAPPPTPAPVQTPGASDDLLPVTGGGATVAVPGVGIVLALVVLGARRLRERFRAG